MEHIRISGSLSELAVTPCIAHTLKGSGIHEYGRMHSTVCDKGHTRRRGRLSATGRKAHSQEEGSVAVGEWGPLGGLGHLFGALIRMCGWIP